MTRRSIQAGKIPTVIIRAGMDVQVEGWDDERVLASTEHKRGLKVERRSESVLGHLRARAKVGDRVIFDVSTDLLKRNKSDVPDDAIQVQAAGDTAVRVPYGSTVKIYAGRSIQARDIRGSVTAYAAHDARLHNIHTVVHVSAGWAMDLDCETLASDNPKFSAGRDLRFYVRDLNHAKIMVDDLGGYWEAVIGDGRRQIRLHAGGDVTLVTDQPVKGQSPGAVLGHIDSPL
ncbi:MAG: hypothetical protein WCF84_01410 [Anaerolineae bacterium]